MKCSYIYIIVLLMSGNFIIAMSEEGTRLPRRHYFSAVVRQWHKLTNSVVESQQLLTTRDQERNKDALVVMTYDVGEAGKKTINAWRLDSDTVVLLWMRMKDGSQVVVASACCKAGWKQQVKYLQEKRDFLQASVQKSKALLLGANDDPGNGIADDPVFWKECENDLGMPTTSCMYRMVPGSEYRDRDHLQITLDRKGVSWKSAIDGFYKEHQL